MRRVWGLGILALAACHRGPRAPDGVVLNEVLSANRTAWVDEDGGECPEYDDAIELYNAGRHAVSLAGYTLADASGRPPWALPDVTLEAGERLVVVADGEPGQGPLHASFKVGKEGETLVLADAEGEIDRVDVPALGDDRSWGRYGDGGLVWREQREASIGAPNESPPDDACFEPNKDFDDHSVPCISTREGFLALASTRAGLDVVKFDILSFQNPEVRHAVFLDSRFFVLHDEWYIYRKLNGQQVEGEDVFPSYPGEFSSMAEIYAWAQSVNLAQYFSSDFLRFTADGRLYSPRYYELALGETRIIGVATLVHIPERNGSPERWAFELEASDTATPDEIAGYFESLKAELPAEISDELRWLVRSTAQEAVAAGMVANNLPYSDRLLHYSDITTPGEVSVYRPGTVAGRVRHIAAGESLDIAVADDLLILDEIPDYLPPGAGLITAVPQTPLAHIALLAESRGIPNLYIGGIDQDPMWDAWARVHAPVAIRATEPDGFEVVALTADEYSTWRMLNVPATTEIHPADITGLDYTVDLTTVPVADMPDWRPRLGGKSTGMVALVGTPGVLTPEEPLGISVRAYREQVAALPWLNDVLTSFEFAHPGDARLRYLVLEGLSAYNERYTTAADATARDRYFEAHPTDSLGELARGKGVRGAVESTPITPAIHDAIVSVLTETYGDYAPEQALRFRSSSNIEDAEGFNGAGLYASYSGYFDPPAGELSVDEAIRAVWASYWGAEAFEERHAINIDHRAGDMGVMVHAEFDDDYELANGVITARRLPDGLSERWEVVVNSQPGAVSVTNPPDDTCQPVQPEITRLTATDTGAVVIERIQRSTELPNADVLTDEELRGLYSQVTAVVTTWLTVENNRVIPEWRRSTLTLDLEWRKVAEGWPVRTEGSSEPERIVLKQSRTLEPSTSKFPPEVLAAPFPRDVLARARVVSRTTCTSATTRLEAVEATTDPQRAPDMGFSADPLTASLIFRTQAAIPALGLAAGDEIELSHLDFTSEHPSLSPWRFSADLTDEAVAESGLLAFTVDDDTLSIDGVGGTWTTSLSPCQTATLWASADTYLADLLDSP